MNQSNINSETDDGNSVDQLLMVSGVDDELATDETKQEQIADNNGSKEFTCDIAIVLGEAEDAATADQLALALTAARPGLIVRVVALTRCKALLVSAKVDSLFEWADDFRLVKRERVTGEMRTFTTEKMAKFEMSDVPEQFFTQAERQLLIQLTIESVRAVETPEIYGKKQLKQGQPILAHLKLAGVVKHFFRIHSVDDLKRLRSKWVSPSMCFHIRQPLDEICSYFDFSIGFYFAWLEFYTKWLCLPAFFGLATWYLSTLSSAGSDNEASESGTAINSGAFLLLIFFNTVWFALFRKFWTRRSNALAFRWGASDHSKGTDRFFAEPRPLFNGTPVINPVTGKPTLHWPSWRRNLTLYCVSVPVTIGCLLLMLCTSVFCLRLDRITTRYAANWPSAISNIVCILPLILFVICLNLFNNLYAVVAAKLNDLENHFSQNDYITQLQAKLIVFRFLNGFLPLFYTAFYERDFKALQDQVAALVMIRQVGSNAIEVLLPYLSSRYQQISIERTKAQQSLGVKNVMLALLQVRRNKRRQSADNIEITDDCHHHGNNWSAAMSKLKLLDQVEKEASLNEFDDCFEDYLEMFVQLGYIMLFSVAFPPIAIWCLLNNLVELKTDALKMCTGFQRPFARRVRDIGIWKDAFELLAVGAVVVNMALVANFDVVTDFFPVSTGNKSLVALIGVVIVEHAIFGLRAFANRVVDDVPDWIHVQLAKREYVLLKERGRDSTLLAATATTNNNNNKH